MTKELTDDQLCGIARGTKTAEPGRDGYILPVAFARAVIAADRAMQDARHREELAAADLTISNLRAAQGVPEGWVLVPVEPSIAACINGSDAAGRVVDGYQCAAVYRAMLAAAPQPAAQPDGPALRTDPDPADIIAGALCISRGHAIEMMREAVEAAPQPTPEQSSAVAQPERKPLTREQIRAEWDTFIEYPSADKLHVTTTSALLFAEHIARKSIKDTP